MCALCLHHSNRSHALPSGHCYSSCHCLTRVKTGTEKTTARYLATGAGVTVSGVEANRRSASGANRAVTHLAGRVSVKRVHSTHTSYGTGLPLHAYESNRRQSFSQCRTAFTVSKRALAANGFYYSSQSDTIKCFSCDLEIKDWKDDKAICRTHQLSSTRCAYIRGDKSVRNVPVIDESDEASDMEGNRQCEGELQFAVLPPKYPAMSVMSRRAETFLTWPTGLDRQPAELIQAGLFYSGSDDVVICYECGSTMGDWDRRDDIWIRHARQSPECQLLLAQKGPEFILSTINEFGFHDNTRVKRVHTAAVGQRQIRPRMDGPVARATIKLGYPPHEVNETICHQLQHREPDFTSVKSLVEAILERRSESAGSNLEENHSKLEADRQQIITKLESRISPPQPTTGSAETAVTERDRQVVQRWLSNLPDTAQTDGGETIREKAVSMKEKLMCKVCLDAAVGVLFLPCSHMVCCYSCSGALLNCPLCRTEVMGRIMVKI